MLRYLQFQQLFQQLDLYFTLDNEPLKVKRNDTLTLLRINTEFKP